MFGTSVRMRIACVHDHQERIRDELDHLSFMLLGRTRGLRAAGGPPVWQARQFAASRPAADETESGGLARVACYGKGLAEGMSSHNLL